MERSLNSLPPYTTDYKPLPNQQGSINGKYSRRQSAFDFRAEGDVCPTCGGAGRVPKGNSRR